jgi:hypothetical protein
MPDTGPDHQSTPQEEALSRAPLEVSGKEDREKKERVVTGRTPGSADLECHKSPRRSSMRGRTEGSRNGAPPAARKDPPRQTP